MRETRRGARNAKVYGPSIGWTVLFLGMIFGTIFVSVYAWVSGGMNLTGLFFFVTMAAVGGAVLVFSVGKYYYVTERGITIRVLGMLKLGSWAWDQLEGTRGSVMRGRYAGTTNATARSTRVFYRNGRVAFTFNFLIADFGGLHNEVFHHIRVARKRREGEP